ncbi:MAG: nickel pincer cofactor biosynthesis protein LarC [Planctomycetes bacterium]|nr:nickel pincer cofactor biosynthesis protein LarC [Planctomycetota bacterium]
MRVAHFDCFSGISGDMTLAALFDLGASTEAVYAGIASLGLPVRIDAESVQKGGFAATQVFIHAEDEAEHRHLPDIEAIITRGNLTPSQRDLALKIFRRLADAEAKAHGIPVGEVHFHEVGALDSIADIVGSAIALDLLGVEKFTSSPVAVGSGTVKCEHGIMPVPTPATAELLKGVPLRSCPVKSELTTPTGAAILTSIVTEYLDTPPLTIEQVGHGAGSKDFLEQPNLLRIFVGKDARSRQAAGSNSGFAQSHGLSAVGVGGCDVDEVYVLETNLDDVPGEIIGYCFERLLAAGALDVWTTPIQMKKNRPGVLLSLIATETNLAELEAILFRETQTFGIRRQRWERHKLQREAITVETPWGAVKAKKGWREGQPPVVAPEYEDCARVARENNVAIADVFRVVTQSYKNV